MIRTHARSIAAAAVLVGLNASTALADDVTLSTDCIATGLTEPVYITAPAGDTERVFVVEVDGLVQIVDLASGTLADTPFLDVTSLLNPAGAGLLGFAFDPDFDQNGYVYAHYADGESFGTAKIAISRFTVSQADPNVVDIGTEHVVLVFDAPGLAHRGGWVGFGDDGYLYAAFGDGGQPCNALELEADHHFGQIIRIDVSGDDFPGDPLRNYAIPSDNPFVGGSNREEIWNYGFRQPWSVHFDTETGDMYIGEVGQSAKEELDFIPAGAGGDDYGWPCREGTVGGFTQCFPDQLCDDTGMIPPVHEYDHDGFIPAAIIGGVVYRGAEIPDLQGTYVFADLYGTFWSLKMVDGEATELTDRTAELDPGGPTSPYVSHIGTGATGEIFILDNADGSIHQIVELPSCPADVNGDGVVSVSDLIAVLLAWNSDDAAADVNADGVVDNGDFLGIFGGWGACP